MSTPSDGLRVGRAIGLWRYPVKSMGAESLHEAEVGWHGLTGDRRWAFVRNDMVRSGFPWLTLRQRNDMNRYSPSFEDPGKPDTSPTLVETPNGDVFDVTDPALAATLCTDGARVIRQNRGVFDTFPLSLITTQTISQLGEAVGKSLDVQRFRPNLLIEAGDDASFPEDDWVGRVIRIGTVRMRIDSRDRRCLVITIDPETAERDPSVLRAVVNERQGCLGVYGTTVTPGRIAVDDPVVVEPPD